jgi:homoserine dehydrogenase
MKETGRAFDDVLAEAQALGYAETPPDLDVDGIDTAHKLSLVSAVSNGTLPAFDAVYTDGSRTVGDYDVAMADKLGFSIKLLGITSATASGKVLQRVHPAMIPVTTALGSTHGVVNGLFTMGDFVGPTFTQGRGAGREATASACVADLIDLARGNMPPVFGVPVAMLKPPVTATMDERVGAYYLRFNTGDQGAVSTLLDGIPVDSIQSDGTYTVVVTANTAAEPDVQKAVAGSNFESQLIRIEGPW